MHIAFTLGIRGHWCMISLYPISWQMFVQSAQSMPTNIAFGPLRLAFN